MSYTDRTICSRCAVPASLIAGLLLGFLTALLAYLGLLPLLAAVIPFVFAFALFALALIIILTAVLGSEHRDGLVQCLCPGGGAIGVAAAILAALSALALTLSPPNSGYLLGAFFVFVISGLFWFLIVSFICLVLCLVDAACQKQLYRPSRGA
jgi:MFS family permease